MTLSNFKLIETTGTSPLNWSFRATVDVITYTESGALWWKKKTRHIRNREIARKYAGFWFFVDDGIFTPGGEAETLARAFTAQTGKIA